MFTTIQPATIQPTEFCCRSCLRLIPAHPISRDVHQRTCAVVTHQRNRAQETLTWAGYDDYKNHPKGL